ncbi:hypothetical protein OG883_41510 [Streptomyces sp. NBC_01142]|uniref:hypothetical protein n=1 Tax=Streptomyces sp. NBC_01142 TaxID=2975865 RepID=UPI00224E7D82|nr:hypothetical protein [Streptomyces sp. NBC_01142]MCX4826151.1 hypothetical protein [Streptomyces sp. NBC_01142]
MGQLSARPEPTVHQAPVAPSRVPRPAGAQRAMPLLERVDVRDVVVPGTANAIDRFFLTGRENA